MRENNAVQNHQLQHYVAAAAWNAFLAKQDFVITRALERGETAFSITGVSASYNRPAKAII
jgi:hypothetical protein